MSTVVMWSKSKPDVEFQYGGRLGEFNGMSSQSHHIAGCCHLVNSLSWFQSHMSHCRVQSTAEINVTIVLVRIPSAILKIVFRHNLYFFLFLMQFKLWRAAAFISSLIHFFVLTQLTNVTDTRTHRQTDTTWRHKLRLCIASRGNKLNSKTWFLHVKRGS